jgi:hypothetical protein
MACFPVSGSLGDLGGLAVQVMGFLGDLGGLAVNL